MAVAALASALSAAEPFIPVFITDGSRTVTPALFPELSVFRESIPSYPVNSSVKIKRFTPLSKAYKYPQEYVRRLSDKERRLTPYRFEEMFADPANTIDSEYARSGKPFFIISHSHKGMGVSYMYDNAAWHGCAPKEDLYKTAVEELDAAIKALED